MKTPWEIAGDLGQSIIGLVSEYIEDPDLRAKLVVEVQKLEHQSMQTLLATSTTPIVDATVKLMYALTALFRPLASIGIFIYGLAHPEALQSLYEIDATVGTVAGGAIFGAAPAWGISRHLEKKEKIKEEQKTERIKTITNKHYPLEDL